ncbi:MAG: VOC family protein [Myxococcota bacterium]
MKDAPEGWPRISSAIFYNDAAKAIDWLCRAFSFEVRLKIQGEDGSVEHSELTYGDGLIMVGQSRGDARPGKEWCASPASLGGKATQALCVCVDDADAHAAHARAAGATIASEPKTTDYGEEYWADRTYEAVDLEGHHWWFMQRVRNPGEKG